MLNIMRMNGKMDGKSAFRPKECMNDGECSEKKFHHLSLQYLFTWCTANSVNYCFVRKRKKACVLNEWKSDAGLKWD